jgi:hypothetical protein
MPWARACWPLKMHARLTGQIDVVTKALLNSTPLLASLSMVGELSTGVAGATQRVLTLIIREQK